MNTKPACCFEYTEHGMEFRLGPERVRIETWGPHSLRVRSTLRASFEDKIGALLPQSPETPRMEQRGEEHWLFHGGISVRVDAAGRIAFFRKVGQDPVLSEPPVEILHPEARAQIPAEGNLNRLEVRFEAHDNEAFYGLGQHRHGRLNQKGCVLDLAHRNCEISIPFLLSSRGYGFLWNHPGTGRVELGHSLTRWVADAAQEIDYWVTAGDSPADILSHYADATGHPPPLPDWATGFWQSKLRYKNQEELLSVAREYKRRELPLSVIVIDFFHWPMMGDLCFDKTEWPDPAAMVKELKEMGVEVMVSVWPSFNPNSENCVRFREAGHLLRTRHGGDGLFTFIDKEPKGQLSFSYYDPSIPEAREAFWSRIKQNYWDLGIRIFWLDACEPEMTPVDHGNLQFRIGPGAEVAGLYPLLHQQGMWEGMKAAGQEDIVTLNRSAWAGSQRYGAAVWSGDIKSTFEVLRAQVRAGLNMAMSGIPWWTTDIGGFHSGHPETPYFRELMIRWFQYGVFCPLCRLHGVREPVADHYSGGADNEVWNFGDEVYAILRDLLTLREHLRPYIADQMQTAHETGLPPMRPLFVDFPDDPAAWTIEDQFMFGPEILVAPVLHEGARKRTVYLPAGEPWRDAWTGEEVQGGKSIEVSAPLTRIPVYTRKGFQFALPPAG